MITEESSRWRLWHLRIHTYGLMLLTPLVFLELSTGGIGSEMREWYGIRALWLPHFVGPYSELGGYSDDLLSFRSRYTIVEKCWMQHWGVRPSQGPHIIVRKPSDWPPCEFRRCDGPGKCVLCDQ